MSVIEQKIRGYADNRTRSISQPQGFAQGVFPLQLVYRGFVQDET